jgi:hypothetical protein
MAKNLPFLDSGPFPSGRWGQMPRRKGLSTVQAALRVLAYLAEHPEGVEAKEVARHLGRGQVAIFVGFSSTAQSGSMSR